MELINKFISLTTDILPIKQADDIHTMLLDKTKTGMNTKDAINCVLRNKVTIMPTTSQGVPKEQIDIICILSSPSKYDEQFLEDCEVALKYINKK